MLDNAPTCRAAMNRQLTALLLISMLLLPGCLQSAETEPSDDVEEQIQVTLPTIVALEQTAGCDNFNSIHCMLPFPSDAFLIEDNSTVTGLRVNYAENTLPVSGSLSNSGENAEIESLNLMDGMSPSTQIMTAFSTLPTF